MVQDTITPPQTPSPHPVLRYGKDGRLLPSLPPARHEWAGDSEGCLAVGMLLLTGLVFAVGWCAQWFWGG